MFSVTTHYVIRSGDLDEMAETARWGLAKIFCLRNEIERRQVGEYEWPFYLFLDFDPFDLAPLISASKKCDFANIRIK